MTEPRRNAIYAVLVALVALLGSYGVISNVQAALWLALGSAVLGLGMAFTFTTKTYGKHAVDDE